MSKTRGIPVRLGTCCGYFLPRDIFGEGFFVCCVFILENSQRLRALLSKKILFMKGVGVVQKNKNPNVDMRLRAGGL